MTRGVRELLKILIDTPQFVLTAHALDQVGRLPRKNIQQPQISLRGRMRLSPVRHATYPPPSEGTLTRGRNFSLVSQARFG